jgi:hypothetical protein
VRLMLVAAGTPSSMLPGRIDARCVAYALALSATRQSRTSAHACVSTQTQVPERPGVHGALRASAAAAVGALWPLPHAIPGRDARGAPAAVSRVLRGPRRHRECLLAVCVRVRHSECVRARRVCAWSAVAQRLCASCCCWQRNTTHAHNIHTHMCLHMHARAAHTHTHTHTQTHAHRW